MTAVRRLTVRDFKASSPRWCSDCGDYAVLIALRKLFAERGLAPESILNISGIGCSGRMPHYLKTHGLHGLHGRTVPVAFGAALANPELQLLIHSGDGDSLSIGANHLFHGLNKNLNCTYLLYDNQIYGLTKSQSSPTTHQGVQTVSHPFGSPIRPVNPVRFALGAGASFVATTADWLAEHLMSTLHAALSHRGFSFVHIAQRCPKYAPDAWAFRTSDWLSVLVGEHGIPFSPNEAPMARQIEHDPSDREAAFRLAEDTPRVLGLFVREERPIYDRALLLGGLDKSTPPSLWTSHSV